eukprot:6408322-Prymnesium_polylepis.1
MSSHRVSGGVWGRDGGGPQGCRARTLRIALWALSCGGPFWLSTGEYAQPLHVPRTNTHMHARTHMHSFAQHTHTAAAVRSRLTADRCSLVRPAAGGHVGLD